MMFEAIRRLLEQDPRIAYALVFGSAVRGTDHAGSDLDVALAFRSGSTPDALELGDLSSRLEAAAGRFVDLVLLDQAAPGLAYRVFREGRVLMLRDPRALNERKVRAILEYLDFRPIEEELARGVFAASARGR